MTAQDDERAVSALLQRLRNGETTAQHGLFELVYDELRVLARRRLASFSKQSVGPTEVVHEMFVRLAAKGQLGCENRRHFFAVAARAMNDLLVERVRGRRAQKRGGDLEPLPLADALSAAEDFPEEFLLLDAALSRLAERDSLIAEVVRLRFFVGLTGDETAAVLEVSPATVDRRWAYAKAWLYGELYR